MNQKASQIYTELELWCLCAQGLGAASVSKVMGFFSLTCQLPLPIPHWWGFFFFCRICSHLITHFLPSFLCFWTTIFWFSSYLSKQVLGAAFPSLADGMAPGSGLSLGWASTAALTFPPIWVATCLEIKTSIGVPILAQWKWIWLASMRTQVRS